MIFLCFFCPAFPIKMKSGEIQMIWEKMSELEGYIFSLYTLVEAGT